MQRVPVRTYRIDWTPPAGARMGTPLTKPLAERLTPTARLAVIKSLAWGFLLSAEKALPVSVYPCSVCGRRLPGKLAAAYWAWFLADESRSAWKVRYCPACAQEHLLALLQSLRQLGESQEVFACVSCGASAEADSDPCYLTLYLPGKEPQEYALQLDSACAAKLRSPIVERGVRLQDRGGLVRGPSPSTSAWDALGLAP